MLIYSHGEWDRAMPALCSINFTFLVHVFVYLSQRHDGLTITSITSAAWPNLQIFGAHMFGIALSMSTYRDSSFTDLARFRGPFWARLSQLYIMLLFSEKLQIVRGGRGTSIKVWRLGENWYGHIQFLYYFSVLNN